VPILTPVPGLQSPPTNAYGLTQYLAQRVPGYDFSEYLRELNSAYIHVWEEISMLQNAYFTNIVQVKVVAQNAQQFDLLYNADGNLAAAISPRLYQISRIRVLPPSGGLFQTSSFMHLNDPDYVSLEANPTATSTQTGPYYFVIYGHGRLRSAIPLAANTTLEISYTYWPVALTYTSSVSPASSVSSVGSAVTGVSSSFTSIVPPDFQPTLPGTATVNEEFIQAELLCNGSQIYRVNTIVSDTSLTTLNPVAPALVGGSQYVLATLPEIPREHIRVIASVALAKVYSFMGDDQRVQEATAIATANLQRMKDSLIERQTNNPPRKQRFQYGVSRRNRAFLR
jgi:hypothetical protein